MEKEQILYIGFNNKKTLILIGTDSGFRVLSFQDVQLLVHRKFTGGIGAIDCLETSNLLAMTGGGLFPHFPPNMLVLWDEHAEKIKAEITFKYEINNIKIKHEFLFVITDYKIYMYALFENLTLKMEIDTAYNPKGLFEANSLDDPGYFAHLATVDNTVQNKDEGVIRIFNMKDFKKVNISAHANSIKCMKFNFKGNFFATASEKGTIVRIFFSDTGKQFKELRRGLESTVIYSLDFDYFDSWLVCISKTGTLHAWSLK